jgi:hypothetical protein
MKMHDYSWDSAYIVMDGAILNRFQKYAWRTPVLSESMIIAETVLTLSDDVIGNRLQIVRMTHSRTIQIYDYSWDCAYIVMCDAIWNRLQAYRSPPPGPLYVYWLGWFNSIEKRFQSDEIWPVKVNKNLCGRNMLNTWWTIYFPSHVYEFEDFVWNQFHGQSHPIKWDLATKGS